MMSDLVVWLQNLDLPNSILVSFESSLVQTAGKFPNNYLCPSTGHLIIWN